MGEWIWRSGYDRKNEWMWY